MIIKHKDSKSQSNLIPLPKKTQRSWRKALCLRFCGVDLLAFVSLCLIISPSIRWIWLAIITCESWVISPLEKVQVSAFALTERNITAWLLPRACPGLSAFSPYRTFSSGLSNKLSRVEPFVSFVLLDVRDHCFPCDNFQGLKFKNFNFAF